MNLAQMLLMARPLRSYQQVILADKPVGFWPLNETSGTVANDLSGNGWNGTYTGGVELAAITFPSGGAAAKFDGSTGYVFGDSGVPTAATTNVTLEAWVNFDGNTSPNGGCALKNGSCSYGSGYGMGNGANSFDTAGADFLGLYEIMSWNPTTVAIPTSGWHHLVIVIGANSASTFYLDGTELATNGNSAINAPTTSWSIATDYNYGARFFDGAIANAAIYNTALTSAQILNHYNAGIA